MFWIAISAIVACRPSRVVRNSPLSSLPDEYVFGIECILSGLSRHLFVKLFGLLPYASGVAFRRVYFSLAAEQEPSFGLAKNDIYVWQWCWEVFHLRPMASGCFEIGCAFYNRGSP